MKIKNRLEIVESAFLALAVIGIVATLGRFSILYAVISLTCSLLFNQINRYRFTQQQEKRTAQLKKLLDRDQILLTQLGEQLKTQSPPSSWVLEQWRPGATGEPQPQVDTGTDRSLFQSLLQRQVLLEQTVQKIQQEIETVVIRFQRRPELEQIDHLTGVIVDLQQFINELPQWGRLQQQELNELRDRVDSALDRLSEERGEVSQPVQSGHSDPDRCPSPDG